MQLIEIQAIGITTSKQLGESAQAAFLSKASGLGFAGDSRSYDMVVARLAFFDPQEKLEESS